MSPALAPKAISTTRHAQALRGLLQSHTVLLDEEVAAIEDAIALYDDDAVMEVDNR